MKMMEWLQFEHAPGQGHKRLMNNVHSCVTYFDASFDLHTAWLQEAALRKLDGP